MLILHRTYSVQYLHRYVYLTQLLQEEFNGQDDSDSKGKLCPGYV